MSRRRHASTVSLFAFQDIITAVTGIFIILVLLLALELAERPQAAASPSSTDPYNLAAAVQQAEQEVEEIKQTVASTTALTEELAQTNPEELRRDIAQLERQLEKAAQTDADLDAHQHALETRNAKIQERLPETQKVRDEVRLLQAELDALQEQLERERQQNRPIYLLPRDFDKRGWAVVLSSDEIAAAPLGRPQAPILFRKRGPLDSASAQFLAWAESQGGETYFLLLVRPSGVKHFNDIKATFLDRNTPFGYDLVGESLVVLDPERGAAQ